MESNDIILKTEHLSHRYSSAQWAIHDINIEVRRREIQGLLGSNGAGKSTLMNIVCGVLRQTSGEVYINGLDIRRNPIETKRLIGFLPQQPPLRTDLTVREYLRYSGFMRWIPSTEIRRAVDEVMEKCRIAHFADRQLRALSGGYQQRVGIAQAIIHKPALVILDEPTNGLDPNQITEIRNLIREIAREHTVILSTHMLTEVQAICDNVLMIEHGNLVFSGTLEHFDNYIAPDSILVRFNAPPASEVLFTREGILRGEQLDEQTFRLYFREEADRVIEPLVNDSVAQGWRLIQVGVEKKSLDSIFAALSKNRKA